MKRIPPLPDSPDSIAEVLRRFDVAARPPRFPAADVSYAAHDTAVGRLLLAVDDTGVLVTSVFAAGQADEEAALDRLSSGVSPRVLRRPEALDGVRRWLDDYLKGQRPEQAPRWSLALATPFQATVLTALAERVGYGERTSYGRLADWSGRPRAARAVGTALGANPLCIVLPCHRVVGSSGALTGYAGGLSAKRYLLELEANPGASCGFRRAEQ